MFLAFFLSGRTVTSGFSELASVEKKMNENGCWDGKGCNGSFHWEL